MAAKDEDTGIYAEYFNLTAEYTAKYGEKMILLMQVGSFFEVYGMKNTENSIITGSAIAAFSQICQLVMSERTYQYQNHYVLIAGFRDYALEKYLQKITENGYTAVVYIQEKIGKKTRRVFHSVNSAGTYVPYENDTSLQQVSNNIMCIWFEQHKSLDRKVQAVCGIAVSNIFTGKSSIYEYNTNWMLNPTTFDELERCMCMYHPSELIVVSPFDENTLQSVLQYSGAFKSSLIHRVNSGEDTAKRCATQKYIKHILSSHFGEDAYNVCSEFSMNAIATQAFCYLLNFIQEHNPNLVRKINIPDFDGNMDSRVLLVNHTLKQLNIIDDSSLDARRSGQYSSILSLLNKCCTTMGRRRFQTQLLMPSYNEGWLNREYTMIELLLSKDDDMIDSLRKVMREIADIEKICRQIVLRRIYPSTIYQLYKSVDCIQQLNTCLYESPELSAYLGESPDAIDSRCVEILETLDTMFIMNECMNLNSTTTFPQCIIKYGNSPELDEFIKNKNTKMKIYMGIRDALNRLIQRHGKIFIEVDYVKEHETDKLGLSLQITNKRGQLLKTALEWLKTQPNPFIEIQVDDVCETIYARDIKVAKATTTNDEIECPLLTKTTRDILHMKDSMNRMIGEIYTNFIIQFEEKYLNTLEGLVEYVSKIDVLFCKVHIARKYNYCRPVIDSSDCKSYMDAKGLRHALIEHIQQNELYVANDICIGKGEDGILLYGTNAVGKTSMIRSVGIVAVMAQAGMYVPCAALTYKPYTAIFSRILGNDNLFKGLSTFAVEMSELRTILKMADDRSLILGDELCSGTETESALSIFMAGLIHLHNAKSSFLFATHFHEIVNYDEITELPNLAMKHLSVYFDRERDCLVYDRILKEGSGTKMYGLEVCKSLYLPEEFLEKAHALRNKYYPESRGALQMKSTKYNAKKIRGMCEICNKVMGEEVHHLQEQQYANDTGYIGGIHKNHPANLISICEKCHDKIHASTDINNASANKIEEPNPKKIVRKKKTTNGNTVIV